MSVTPEQYDLIRRPIITEKATLASECGAGVIEDGTSDERRQGNECSARS